MSPTRFLAAAAAAAAALAVAACQKTETAEQMQARMQSESDSARAAIEQAAVAFARHVNAGHADSLTMMYAPNATLMAPNMAAATGHDAIRAAFTGMMESGSYNLHLAVQSVMANGPLAVERGKYHITFTPTGGTAMPDSGKYLVHWHKVDGSWMMVDDIWNSDVAMAAPAAPARRR